MSIFGDLMNKIRGHAARQNEEKVNAAVAENAPSASTPSMAPTATAAPEMVDIHSVLQNMASANSQKLDWENSIVDLMKLVGMDSSLTARRALAQELGYTGDTGDTATMNIWLQKQVMEKMAENGGKVPASMTD